jgi:transposase
MEEPRVILVGVDWASQAHEVCVLDGAGAKLESFSVEHSGEGLDQLGERIARLAGGDLGRVKVAIEVPRGVVVETLLALGCCVFSLNPKQLDRFRDRYTVAGAKDDRRDAYVLADCLRTDEHLYRQVRIPPEVTIVLRECLSMRNELVREERRLANQLREQLLRYYPQVLAISPGADDPWLLALLDLAPTPEQGAALPRGQVSRILRKHRVRRFTADDILSALRRPPLRPAPGVVAAASAHVGYLVERLRLIQIQKRRSEKTLDNTLAKLETEDGTDEHRDAAILLSMPGAGRYVVATMLAEAPEAIQRRDYHALRMLSGAAPVTKQSGKTCFVLRRRACNHNLQDAVYHWARVAIRDDVLMAMLYKQARERGKKHGTAIRIVVDRLLAIMCAALRHRTRYNISFRLNKEAA